MFGKNIYSVGKKHWRRCKVYFYHAGTFCPCCGMQQLRLIPPNKEGKERLRQERRIVR
ncbi:MAG TPA: hypothetical protein VI278_16510 [Nitrososphaeraceae archaeon]